MENTWQNYSLVANTTIIPDMMKIVSKRYVTFASQLVLTFLYIIGVIGNLLALVILSRDNKGRNRKHLLMLRCLAINDLVALAGMLVQMYFTIYVGRVTSTKLVCSLRIIWRFFGLFSGCVAFIMAIERWLALTRPFVYQKVTYPVIVRCIIALWIISLVLASLPLMGFGVFYKSGRCVRYREATDPSDIAYAYVWFTFGTVLCTSIVSCNLTVSKALKKLHRTGALRRISKASSRAKPLLNVTGPPNQSEGIITTPEEKAFSKLMKLLSISFVVCWMPQMISIPLAQYAIQLPQTAIIARKCIRIFHVVADIVLCTHFTLDPYIYVLLRMPLSRFHLLNLCQLCSNRKCSNSFSERNRQCTNGDPPTPITEAPSVPVSEDHELHIVTYF
ncbi:prostaglandin E2 receptor EP2 subtype isoform X2 [Pseudomyrmex gracilis]|uniref:prostaglandin E2 receptor EP2 subtype isoform X2 n=1 Tax=Pseudomyrmex gracilis TaxID=219809 RepID=UPI0009950DE0|nr:prostaglandin E2 receptor EP2 subtype isoform X2 [Pseudomyrmex gracilis]